MCDSLRRLRRGAFVAVSAAPPSRETPLVVAINGESVACVAAEPSKCYGRMPISMLPPTAMLWLDLNLARWRKLSWRCRMCFDRVPPAMLPPIGKHTMVGLELDLAKGDSFADIAVDRSMCYTRVRLAMLPTTASMRCCGLA